MLDLTPRHEEDAEDHWIPLSDLMTGLMMFFMLIAVAFMVKVEADAAKTKRVAVLYEQLRSELYNDLNRAFHSDLPRWGAELTPDLTIRFTEPDVLFETGSYVIRPRFKRILTEFFPRYAAILTGPKYKNSIEELRIEGHTSTLWTRGSSADEAYFGNMELSQARTRALLTFVLEMPEMTSYDSWLQAYATANGLSSSRLVRRPDGTEDTLRSQRVEIRVRTNAEARLAEILSQ